MIHSTSTFLGSSIPVLHNAVKSIIFRGAELLMILFIFKLFSLAAARSNRFTSYLMFSEDHIQRWFFLSSRGLSRTTLIVLLFTIFSMLASLYGTLLWALDAPGYIFRTLNSTMAEQRSALNPDPPYIVQLHLDPNNLDHADKTLAHSVGTALFEPGSNITLTGEVRRGDPKTVKPTRYDDVGARIWLDEEGFSVSAHSRTSTIPMHLEIDNQKFPWDCAHWGDAYGLWNCTFNNTFAQGFIEDVSGLPEIHWDDESDLAYDWRYIWPGRVDNVWRTFGAGGGSAAMMQVFTITKGRRRHTFAETVLRATMVTNPGFPFAPGEIDDLVRRAAGPSETERADPGLGQIVDDILSAQSRSMSYRFGINVAENENTVLQNSWAFLTPLNVVSKEEVFSIVTLSSTNITLIRSEDIDEAPKPLTECSYPYQNEAFGGRLRQTDCVGAEMIDDDNRFYGTVDTAAVMIVYGLGAPRSNISSESFDETVSSWVFDNWPRMLDLLVARGYAASVDPSLVGVSVETLTVAISGLQLLLSVFAAVLAIAAWCALSFCADEHWSKSFLGNVVHTTLFRGTEESKSTNMDATPNVDLIMHGDGSFVAVEGRQIVLQSPPASPVVPAHDTNGEPPKEGIMVDSHGAGGYSYAQAV